MRRGIGERFVYNRALLRDFDGFVYSQSRPPVNALLYGSAGKRFGEVGCGVAAVCNIMRLLGKSQPLAEVLREAEQLRLPLCGARLGTKLFAPARYFRRHGVPFRRVYGCRACRALLPQYRAALICTWNDRFLDGVHFYCVFRDAATGALRSLNFADADSELPFDPEQLRPRRFIRALLF